MGKQPNCNLKRNSKCKLKALKAILCVFNVYKCYNLCYFGIIIFR